MDGTLLCKPCADKKFIEQSQANEAARNQPIIIGKRDPRVAAILSFLISGLGQLYNGQKKRALTAFISVNGGFVAILLFFSILNSNRQKRVFEIDDNNVCAIIGILYTMVLIFLWIYGIFDAYKTAKKINNGEAVYDKHNKIF